MKKYVIMGCLLLSSINTDAQFLKRLKDKVVDKTEQKAETKADRKIDAAVDSVMEGNVHMPKKENAAENSTPEVSHGSENTSLRIPGPQTGYVSNFDFVPGEQVVFFEDFTDGTVGDFPAKWNTSGSGEVVTLDGLDGKWLMMQNQSNFSFGSILDLPENCTIQFEIMISLPFEWRNEPIYFAMGDIKNPDNYLNTSHYSLNDYRNITFWLNLHPGASTSNFNGYGGYLMNNTSTSNLVNEKVDLKNYFIDVKDKLPLKVAVWKQKERLRVYLDENKILDLPKILPAEMKINTLVWQTLSLQGDNKYFLGNMRVAAGNPDTRNKLLTEGKLVSNGILFGVNSDIIKPESFGILKEIAGVLKENQGLTIRIIGHTDDDGDEANNLSLSVKRALAVKKALSENFKIDAARMETDGRGESEPLLSNSDAVNKANNRRVEFINVI